MNHFIKLDRDFIQSKKIQHILANYRSGHKYVCIWLHIIDRAAFSPRIGYLLVTADQPITPKDIGRACATSAKITTQALDIFEQLEMLTNKDGTYCIEGLGDHQSIDVIEKINLSANERKEQAAVAAQRELWRSQKQSQRERKATPAPIAAQSAERTCPQMSADVQPLSAPMSAPMSAGHSPQSPQAQGSGQAAASAARAREIESKEQLAAPQAQAGTSPKQKSKPKSKQETATLLLQNLGLSSKHYSELCELYHSDDVTRIIREFTAKRQKDSKYQHFNSTAKQCITTIKKWLKDGLEGNTVKGCTVRPAQLRVAPPPAPELFPASQASKEEQAQEQAQERAELEQWAAAKGYRPQTEEQWHKLSSLRMFSAQESEFGRDYCKKLQKELRAIQEAATPPSENARENVRESTGGAA